MAKQIDLDSQTEASRAIVLEFCERLGQPDLEGMFNLLHDDATWTMVGDPETCFFGGVHSKKKVKAILDKFIGEFETFSFEVLHSFAEGNCVAVKGASHEVLPDGREYKNDYLMQYTVSCDKIRSIIEFFNPLRVFQFIKMGIPS